MDTVTTLPSHVRPGLPGYAGAHSTFAYTLPELDAARAAQADVVIVGAPFDEGTTGRPGARLGPRAIRQADDLWAFPGREHLTLGVDPFATLTVVDHGDVPPAPGRHRASLDALRDALVPLLEGGAIPVVLGGDHSVAHAMFEALRAVHGPEALASVRLDAHTDVEDGCPDWHHGNVVARAVRTGALAAGDAAVLGVRGGWEGARAETEGWRERDMMVLTMDDVDDRGVAGCVDALVAHAADAERVYLSVDVDVLDPAFAPGTGTPEPGGLTTRELLRAVRELSHRLPLCAVDVVEVCPPFDPSDVTALAAHRTVVEALTGIARRRLTV